MALPAVWTLLGHPQEAGNAHREQTFRFLAAPPLWVIALIVVPGIALVAFWSYGGLKRLERRPRIALSLLRGLAVACCCLLLFQPAWETTTYRTTQNQVHVLVDDSASMSRRDSYPDDAQQRALAAAAGPLDL